MVELLSCILWFYIVFVGILFYVLNNDPIYVVQSHEWLVGRKESGFFWLRVHLKKKSIDQNSIQLCH
jgi:hypothetical protein